MVRWLKAKVSEAADAAAQRTKEAALSKVAERRPDLAAKVEDATSRDPMLMGEHGLSAHDAPEFPPQALPVKWQDSGERFGVRGRVLDPDTWKRLDLHDPTEVFRVEALTFGVAGVAHHLKAAQGRSFMPGRLVTLAPEPGNRHDRNAIAVLDATAKTLVGYVPRDEPLERDAAPEDQPVQAQRVLNKWLAAGPIQAAVIRDRPWFEDGQETRQRGGLEILVARRLIASLRSVPQKGEPGYDAMIERRHTAERDRWPDIREQIRSRVAGATNPTDRHFALQVLIQEAYARRDSHPEALEDAIQACRDQIALAPTVARAMKVEYAGDLPSHVGYKQLAIILEKQKRFTDALDLVREAQAAGWDGDWSKRIERLRKKA